MQKTQYWVYILLCANNTYYTGYTDNLLRRYQSHCEGTGNCKYTRSFKPLSIAQSWQIQGTRASAMKVERHIKKLTRDQKEKYIKNPELLATDVNLPDAQIELFVLDFDNLKIFTP